jgi:hypothetical protein
MDDMSDFDPFALTPHPVPDMSIREHAGGNDLSAMVRQIGFHSSSRNLSKSASEK